MFNLQYSGFLCDSSCFSQSVSYAVTKWAKWCLPDPPPPPDRIGLMPAFPLWHGVYRYFAYLKLTSKHIYRVYTASESSTNKHSSTFHVIRQLHTDEQRPDDNQTHAQTQLIHVFKVSGSLNFASVESFDKQVKEAMVRRCGLGEPTRSSSKVDIGDPSAGDQCATWSCCPSSCLRSRRSTTSVSDRTTVPTKAVGEGQAFGVNGVDGVANAELNSTPTRPVAPSHVEAEVSHLGAGADVENVIMVRSVDHVRY